MSGSDQELEAFFKKKKLKSKKKAIVKIDDIGKQLDQHTMEEMNSGINAVKDFPKPTKELYGIKSNLNVEKVAWKVEDKESEVVPIVAVEPPKAKYVPPSKQVVAPAGLNINSEQMFPSISMAEKLAKEFAMAERLEQERRYAEKLEHERLAAELLEKAKNAPKKFKARKEAAVNIMKDGTVDDYQLRTDKVTPLQAPGATSVTWRDDTRQNKENPAQTISAIPDKWRSVQREDKEPLAQDPVATLTSWRAPFRESKQTPTRDPVDFSNCWRKHK